MKKILHIDASTFFRKTLQEAFEKNGFIYSGAQNTAEAMEILKNEAVNIICSATEFEDSGIEEFLRNLNLGTYKSIPVFIISSNDSFEERRRVFELGIVDYIKKNIAPSEIVEYIINCYKHHEINTEMRDARIAVVDDSRTTLNIITNIFESFGMYNVDYYEDFESIKKNKIYDCYIIDLILKEETGKKIISKLRGKNRESTIIAISGIDNYKTISSVLTEGADDYIIKPFNRELFVARIRTNLRNYFLLQEIKVKNELLQQMVITDGLTKVYNHKYMYDRLEVEIKEAKRYDMVLSVIMIDIDDFKMFNDTYGHQTGDMVLSETAKIIKNSLRDIDIVGRYGGEEFLAILPQTDAENGYLAAERIRLNIQNTVLKDGLRLTVSGGIKEFQDDDAIELVEKVDSLLYLAKRNGKNRIEK